jgi:hypothetical protein
MSDNARRSSDHESSALKNEILNALGQVSDPSHRVVLTLLIRVMDEISGKLDRVLSDEDKIKHIVLNGHSTEHDAHHDWVANQIAYEISNPQMIELAKDRHRHGGYCDYASRKKKEEDASIDSSRKIKNGVIERIIWAVIMMIVGAIGSAYLHL